LIYYLKELNNKYIIQVACGCFHTIVLSKNGKIYSFGWGSYLQLGQGDTEDRFSPCIIDSSSCDIQNHCISQIACGTWHSACISNDGLVFSFGWNQFGQLGHGDTIGKILFFKEIYKNLRKIITLLNKIINRYFYKKNLLWFKTHCNFKSEWSSIFIWVLINSMINMHYLIDMVNLVS
jgi:alpha-tubulin suppressor-like RCC1 family protein